MNSHHAPLAATPTQQGPSARISEQVRRAHRQRDFGIGYGDSSGYASANRRCYAQSWARQPFSCW